MAYSSFTWDKDHGCGAVLTRVYAVVSSATGDINCSTLSEDGLGRISHSLDTVWVKLGCCRDRVRSPAEGEGEGRC